MKLIFTLLVAGFIATNTTAQEYSPHLETNIPDRPLFGDTHLHTSYSFDAGMVGNTLDPDQAYRFAKGETVTASLGEKAKLRRPLDFLMVSDHAESLGIAPLVNSKHELAMNDPIGKQLVEVIESGDVIGAYKIFAVARAKGTYALHTDEVRRIYWDNIIEAAEKHNQPNVFSTLIGYEYTSSIATNNLHRVVMFKDGGEKTAKILPFSMAESADPEDLWQFMADYEADTGGSVLAIPHNGNLSNGMMFDDKRLNGEPLTQSYAQKRQRFEPVYEVTQIKGDGEAHPTLSPNDEFADYMTWDKGNFGFERKIDAMLPNEYAREALKRGLKYEQELAVNPFKFGMIGATDSHTSLATPDEDNFFSKATPAEPGGGSFRYEGSIIQEYEGKPDVSIRSYESTASGLAGVWALENTRESIYDAFARREVYGTTGPRMAVRLFAGWSFDKEDQFQHDLAVIGYRKGVPMGADLANAPEGKAMQLLIEAKKDPDGANLDRVQVVKGWLDANGKTQEKVYNVAWSDGRKLNHQGQLPSLKSTVKGDTYLNSSGSPELVALWTDPDFDPSVRSFYYVRVLEIATPTWLAVDKARFGEKAKIPANAIMESQERAYTSPVWYTPKG